MQGNILIIEDDPDLSRLARLHLEDHGFQVEVESDGRAGYERALAGQHDLVLLDLTLPGMEGLEICRRIRETERYTPILMVTARGSEVDRVLGLELGADDYLTKPLSQRELVARVKAILRRVEAMSGGGEKPAERPLERGGLSIDFERRSVHRSGVLIDLTAKEFDLLAHFAAHPGRVYTRTDLVDAIWGPGYEGYEHTVNSHINRLRGKVNAGGPRQRFIQTVWGVGYRFTEDG